MSKNRESEILTESALPWHKSMITPIALIVAAILLLVLLSNLYIGIQSINALSGLIHDKDVDKTLENNLKHIRTLHSLKQELVTERLKPFVNSWIHHNHNGLSKIGIQTWMNSLEGDLLPKVEISMITQLGSLSSENRSRPIFWHDKEHLQILNFYITFPKDGPLYSDFSEVMDIRQRYHLMGTEIFEQLRPTLIHTSALVLLISFMMLATCIFIFAKKLRLNLSHILYGLERWRFNDFNFRFEKSLPGELDLIAKQFNAMARDVETSRQKALYLEKVASWQVIARKLAHEIKNPLTPIQMMVSQVVRSYKGDDEKFKRVLKQAQEIISEEVTGLRHLVDHFSDFARLPSPQKETKDLVPLINKLLDLQKVTFENHHITYKGPLRPCMVSIDEKLMRQVLQNLIKNAAEAGQTSNGQHSPTISVDLYESHENFVIEVEDNGPGIPEDMKKRIFEAYFTTKHTGPSPGMGLGLAICQKIIIDHGGDIEVESEPGKTIFYIKLPKEETGLKEPHLSRN